MRQGIYVKDIVKNINLIEKLPNLTIISVRAVDPETGEKLIHALMVKYTPKKVGFHKVSLDDLKDSEVVGTWILDKVMLTSQDSPLVDAINEQGYCLINLKGNEVLS